MRSFGRVGSVSLEPAAVTTPPPQQVHIVAILVLVYICKNECCPLLSIPIVSIMKPKPIKKFVALSTSGHVLSKQSSSWSSSTLTPLHSPDLPGALVMPRPSSTHQVCSSPGMITLMLPSHVHSGHFVINRHSEHIFSTVIVLLKLY